MVLAKQFLKSCIKTVLILISLTGFLYQTSILIKDYFSGSTVVSIKVGMIQDDWLPAVTICTDKIFPNDLTKNFDENLWNEYDNFIRSLSNIGNNSTNMKKIEEDYSIIKHKFINYSKTGFDLLNYTIRNFRGLPPFDFDLFGTYFNKSWVDLTNYSFRVEPIESISTRYWDDREIEKCFTFHSYLQPIWRETKFKLEDMMFFINYWLPQQIVPEIKISMHSPNTLPLLRDFLVIPTHIPSTVQFSQIKTELLGSDYDTNCQEYNLDYKYANFNMRSDCITDCFQKRKQNCGRRGLANTGDLFRVEFLKQNRNLKFEDFCDDFQVYIRIKSSCLELCRPDCNFDYYSYERKDSTFKSKNEGIEFYLAHSHLPDVILKYSPQVSFISFWCSFGGLLGMWLGLSILTISESCLNILFSSRCTSKFILSKFTNLFNQNNYNNIFINFGKKQKIKTRRRNYYNNYGLQLKYY